MVEWVIIIIIVLIIPVFWGFTRITWNIAKGGVDLMALFGNAGRAGTVRQMSNNEINDRKKGTNKKWSMNGKKK